VYDEDLRLTVILISLLLFSCLVGQHVTDTMAINTWVMAPVTNTCSDIEPDPLPAGALGQKGVMQAWGGAAYDYEGHRLIVWGGGHKDYSGNEVYAFDMETYTWSVLKNPTAAENVPESGKIETYDDGNPSSRHTYDGLVYLPTPYETDGALLTIGGSVWNNGYSSDSLWTFLFSDSTWVRREAAVASYVWALSARSTIDSCVYIQRKDLLWKFDPSDNSIAELNSDGDEVDLAHAGTMAFHAGDTSVYYMADGTLFQYAINSNYHHSVNTSGETDIENPTAKSLAYEPILDMLVSWDGDQDIYLYDKLDSTWSIVNCTGDDPGSGQGNGTYGRFGYMPDYDAFYLINSVYDSVYFLKLSEGDNSGSHGGSLIQTFTLTPDTTASNPYTVGLGFGKGDVTAITLDMDTSYQVDVMKQWNDGSYKHVIVSGITAMDSGVARTIGVYSAGSVPTGSDLTASDITTAAPTASIGVSGIDTVTLASLFASPVRTWISGPEMVECHYQADMGDTISIKFHVRLYSNDDIWIRAIVENGVVNIATGNKTYTPTIIIGDSTWNNGGSSYTHQAHTRYCIDHWIGSSGPAITITQDCDYLEESELVPNYWKESPSAGILNGLTQTYAPGENGDWTNNMGDAGYQDQIGLLPDWEALYINSDGDSRAFNSVIANAKALNTYAICWADSGTDLPILLTDWSTWTVDGEGGGGATIIDGGSYDWDVAHHGSGGYLAYLITGDYYHLETMQYQSTAIYMVTHSNRGSDTTRIIRPVQTRGVAWSTRTVGQLCAIAPFDSVSYNLEIQLKNSIAYWDSVQSQVGMNEIGYIYAVAVGAGTYETGHAAPWQQHFWVQTWGMMRDLEPTTNLSLIDSVCTYLYKAVVGILGPNGASNYCYTEASNYTIKIATSEQSDQREWMDSWGVVFDSTEGSPNIDCGSTLSGTLTPIAYWANLLPAIAYAVENSATGAYDAWQRLTSAGNWSTFEDSGFDDNPVWGIYPRATPGGGGTRSITGGGDRSITGGGDRVIK